MNVWHNRKKIGVFEPITIHCPGGEKAIVEAKVDTGAFRSSIDRGLAEKLGLLLSHNVVGSNFYRSSLGKSQQRKIIKISFELAGVKMLTTASVAERGNMLFPMLIGRRDLAQFAVVYDADDEPEKAEDMAALGRS